MSASPLNPPSGGGITDAPSDGTKYSRQNGAWIASPSGAVLAGGRVTPAMLAEMGNSYADLLAVDSLFLKQCGSGDFVTLRALNGAMETGAYECGHVDFANNYHGYVPENANKPVYVWTASGTYTWTSIDAIEAQLVSFGILPSSWSHTFASAWGSGAFIRAGHCLSGENVYMPTWYLTDIAATPTDQPTLLSAWITGGYKAKYNPSTGSTGVTLYSSDVDNEGQGEGVIAPSTSTYGQSGPAGTLGFRTGANGNYTATLINHPTDPMFQVKANLASARSALPGTLLSYKEYGHENAFLTDSNFRAQLPDCWNSVTKTSGTIAVVDPTYSVLADNSRSGTIAKSYRFKDNVYQMLKAGAPLDIVGFQLHVEINNPINTDDLKMSLKDFNRWGVPPHIGELSVQENSPNAAVTTTEAIERFGAVQAKKVVDVFLKNTKCPEVTFWSTNTGNQTAHTWDTVNGVGVTHPIYDAIKLSVYKASWPASARAVQVGTRINWRYLPCLIVASGVTGTYNTDFSQSGSLKVLTSTFQAKMPWDYLNGSWIPTAGRVIPLNNFVLKGQCPATANPAADTFLATSGKVSSGNYAAVIVNSSGVMRAEMKSGGSIVGTMNLGTISLTADNAFSVHFDGTGGSSTAMTGSLNAAAAVTGTATAVITDHDNIWMMTGLGGGSFSGNITMLFCDIEHGADFNSAALIQAHATAIIRETASGAYIGN